MDILLYIKEHNQNICLRDDCEIMLMIIKKLKMMDIKNLLNQIPQENMVISIWL